MQWTAQPNRQAVNASTKPMFELVVICIQFHDSHFMSNNILLHIMMEGPSGNPSEPSKQWMAESTSMHGTMGVCDPHVNQMSSMILSH